MLQLLLIAARNLAQHRLRTLLLGGAIAAVTTLLVLLIGLSNGAQVTLLRSATTLMTGHVNVGGFYKVTSGQAAPVVTHFPKVLEIVHRAVPELDYVTERGRGWAKLVSDTNSQQVGVAGIDIRNEPGFRKVIQPLSGTLEDLAQPNTVLLFEDQAKKLDVKVGDTLTLSAPTPRGTNNTLDLRVVAIARNMGLLSSFNVFVPGGTLRSLYQLNDDATGVLLLYLKDIEQADRIKARLRDAFASAGYGVMDDDPRPFFMKFQSVTREDWTGQKLDITTWQGEISFIKWLVSVVGVLSFFLIFVLVVLIAIGIMNTLWIAIRERTREIGTLRAIGMQRGRVMWMFLLESMLLSLTGTAAGLLLGLLACATLNQWSPHLPRALQLFLMSDHLQLVVSWPGLAVSLALITLCTTLISLIPSYLAARLKPITAMHHVG